MINFLKRLFFSKKKDAERDKYSESNFKDNVLTALQKCKKEKETEIENISNIKKWAKDIIFEIFDVPTAYWYEELNEYENIKFHENNLSINKILIQKTDKIIEGYKKQIILSNSKIDFCKTLIKEYEDIIIRHKETINTIKRINSEEDKLKLLNKHKKRIANMHKETANFEEIYEKTCKLELLNENIEKIEEDFRIKQEVKEYIENLDKEFADDIENTNNAPIVEEINKLTKEIKNK